MLESTPVRRLGATNDFGCRVLSETGLTYADGAEERLAQIVGAADDISSGSEELAAAATDWGTTYSLVPTRANIVRALDLTPEMKVLEIGCGCGPITRYLGEQCGTVDAIEPMVDRARVARLRTRDLDSVEVFVGMLDDVPAEPTYDVVVVIGVLEYVGGGTQDPEPYLQFLRQCYGVLKEGGTLALAIENPLGVKYVAGAVEDHTNRPFDSLEDYVLASPARTFTRRVLEEMVASVGFGSQVLGAFPDYKLPRAILTDDLVARSPQLAANLPRFPSPDYLVPRMNLADEALTWRTLVSSGVAQHFANSFLVLASKGSGPQLWSPQRLGLLFSTERRKAFAVRGEVGESDGQLTIRRELMHPGTAAPAGTDEVSHRPAADERVVPGTDLLRVMLEHPQERATLLNRWKDLVPSDGSEWMPVDLVPHNIVVDGSGDLVPIDQEWFVRGYSRTAVLVRGLLHAAVQMAMLTRPPALSPWTTVGDAVEAMAEEIDVDLTDEVLADFFEREARFQASTAPLRGGARTTAETAHGELRQIWAQPLVEVRGGERFDVQWAHATAHLSLHVDELAGLREQLSLAREDLAREQQEREAVYQRALAAEAQRERLMRRSLYGAVLRVRRRLARR